MRTMSWILGIAAAIVAIIGIAIAYHPSEIMGGDAYNAIIAAGRGAAVVGCSLVLGILAVLFAVSAGCQSEDESFADRMRANAPLRDRSAR
jgi:hypothetical protein